MLSISDYLKYVPFMLNKGKNQIVIDQLVEYFKKSIEDESENSKLYYHTYFEITLRKEDYDDRYQALKLVIIPGAVKRFNKIIKSKGWRYPNYNHPHSPFWQFQFTPEVDQAIQESSLKPFEIKVTKGRLCPTGYTVDNTNDQVDVGTLTVSVKTSTANSGKKVQEFVYNKEEFVDVKEPLPGVYIFPMNVSKTKNDGSNSSQHSTVYAVLESQKVSFVVKRKFVDKHVKTFEMTTKKLYLAGRNAQNESNGISTLIVDDNNVLMPHALLEYKNGKLYISSDQDVRVDGKEIRRMTVELKTESVIVLNKSIQINVKNVL